MGEEINRCFMGAYLSLISESIEDGHRAGGWRPSKIIRSESSCCPGCIAFHNVGIESFSFCLAARWCEAPPLLRAHDIECNSIFHSLGRTFSFACNTKSL